MKIVLTGASGFIGGAILKRLMGDGAGEHRVICLSSSDAGQEKLLSQWPDLQVFPLRAINEQRTRQAIQDADALVHCGWSTVPRTADADPEKDLLENVYHGLPLIRAAASAAVQRFIFLSSGGTVYDNSSGAPFTEDHPTHPASAYGISKLTFEHYLRAHTSASGMRHLILRPGNIYGRASDPLRPQGVIEHWMQRIIHDQPLVIWGDTAVVRDYVHVDDLVKVIMAALTYGGNSTTFNVGSGKGTSLDELIQTLEELAGRTLEVEHHGSDTPGTPSVNILDNSLLRQELGVVPEKPLREGMQQLWNDLQQEHKRRLK